MNSLFLLGIASILIFGIFFIVTLIYSPINKFFVFISIPLVTFSAISIWSTFYYMQGSPLTSIPKDVSFYVYSYGVNEDVVYLVLENLDDEIERPLFYQIKANETLVENIDDTIESGRPPIIRLTDDGGMNFEMEPVILPEK